MDNIKAFENKLNRKFKIENGILVKRGNKETFEIGLDLTFYISIEAKNNIEAQQKAIEKLKKCISKKWLNAGGNYNIHNSFDYNDVTR